jgi:hypothetical protein
MPFALITVGILLFMTALNNTWRAFGSQVYKDLFSESGGFVYWVAGITIVGLIGYVPSLKRPSDLFMVLIIIAMLLQNKGFFQELQQGLAGGSSGGTGGAQAGAAGVAGAAAQPATGLFSGPLGAIISAQQSSGGFGNSTPLTTPAPGSSSGSA